MRGHPRSFRLGANAESEACKQPEQSEGKLCLALSDQREEMWVCNTKQNRVMVVG